MKKLLILCLAFSLAFSAEPNPFADSGDSGGGDESIFDDADTGTKTTNKMMFLDAVQKKFWSPSRKPSDNTLNIKFVAGETHKIRTRANMTTTIILDGDKIASVIIGDSVGFEMKELGTSKYDLSNILTIKPKLIGIDTNLTIIGESGNIYSFYVFSTDHKNRRNPAFLVFVSEIRKIDKIKVENLEEKAKKEQEKAFKKLIGNDSNSSDEKEYNDDTKHLSSFQLNDAIEEETDKEIIIGDKINKIKIKKSEIKRVYTQYPKKNRGVVSKAAVKLQAKDIFHDKKWTYFKFDRELATSKFPAIFRVIDGYDNPMNSRIVGNYLIVETIADKWTMRIGNEWVCVRSEEDIINAIQEQKERDARKIKLRKLGESNRKGIFKPKKQTTPLTDAVFDDFTQESQVQEIIQKQNYKSDKSDENTQSAVENPQDTENVEVENAESVQNSQDTTQSQELQENEVIDSADSTTQTPTLTQPQVEVKEVLSAKEDNEIQEQDYQGEFSEQEKEMTEEQRKEVESHYKDLELPQGMPIENVIVKENDM